MQAEARHEGGVLTRCDVMPYLVHQFVDDFRDAVFDFLDKLYTCKCHELVDHVLDLRVKTRWHDKSARYPKIYSMISILADHAAK